MSLVKSVDDVTSALITELENQTQVDFDHVYYGDEEHVPATPACSVSVERESELSGTNYRMVHTFTGLVVMYHSDMQDARTTRSECVRQAESIESVLHTNTLNGIVVQSWVSALKPGFSVRNEKVILKSTELSWVARSVTYG
jgi:hypothetical protein